PNEWKSHEQGSLSVLTGSAARSRFKARVEQFHQDDINQELREDFRTALDADNPKIATLRDRFVALCESVGRREDLDDAERAERSSIVGELRERLARVCINALEPDLIILDEFQRFKDLLHGDDQAALLARALFTYESADHSDRARVLMLSATPY